MSEDDRFVIEHRWDINVLEETGRLIDDRLPNILMNSHGLIEDLRLEIIQDVSRTMIPYFLQEEYRWGYMWELEMIVKIYKNISSEFFSTIVDQLIRSLIEYQDDIEPIKKLLTWLVQYSVKNIEYEFVRSALDVSEFVQSYSGDIPECALRRIIDSHGSYLTSLSSLLPGSIPIRDAIGSSTVNLMKLLEPYQMSVRDTNTLIRSYGREISPNKDLDLVMDEYAYKLSHAF